MPAKCPCGKNKCDCCKKKAEESGLKNPDFDARFDDRNMSFLGGQKSKVQIAWVKKHCKFAAPRTHQDIKELPDRPGLNIIKPYTPNALEESEWGRTPEDPQSTETFMNMHKRDLAERLKDAQYALSKIGTQQPSWSLKSGNDFVSYAAMIVVTLKDALAIAQTLEVFSQHHKQQAPGESARLGSSRPSAKNAAFGNDPLNADPSAKNAVPFILPQNADQQPAPKNAAPIAENADQGLDDDYFDENSARDMAGSAGGMLIQDETERLAIENEEFNLGYKPPGGPSKGDTHTRNDWGLPDSRAAKTQDLGPGTDWDALEKARRKSEEPEIPDLPAEEKTKKPVPPKAQPKKPVDYPSWPAKKKSNEWTGHFKP